MGHAEHAAHGEALAAAVLRVEVVFCPAPGLIDSVSLQLPPGATVADALAASGLPARHGLIGPDLRAGVWSKTRPLDTLLRDLDRVELYRPLTVDPKEARRQRYRKHRDSARAAPGKSTSARA